jgi:UDP-N-acetylmuramate--alanine ligase
MGKSDWMVVEADESDGTFNRLPATIAIVTNIDAEHMDHYGSFDALREAFFTFVSNIPFYGVAVCCTDHPEVQSLVGKVNDRRVVTYGFNPQADVRAENLRYESGAACFDVELKSEDARIDGLCLPMPGDHNVMNMLAAIAVARHLGISADDIKTSVTGFRGVNRRFTRVGVWNGVTIIDDYAHHPVEIAAVLKAARQSSEGCVIAIHQPHRFSRLRDLFDEFCGCFNDADVVGITDIYAAGEDHIEGADGNALVAGLVNHGHRNAIALEDETDLSGFVREHAEPGDIVICLGAGSISAWANDLPEQLK